MTYEEWKKLDSTYSLIIEIIYEINRGAKYTLEERLIEEYKKEQK